MAGGNIADKIKQVFISNNFTIVRTSAPENSEVSLAKRFAHDFREELKAATNLDDTHLDRVIEQLDNLDGRQDGVFSYWDVYGDPNKDPYSGGGITAEESNAEKVKRDQIFAKLAQSIEQTFVDSKHLPSDTDALGVKTGTKFEDKPTKDQARHQANETKLNAALKQIAKDLKADGLGALVLKAAKIDVADAKDLKLAVSTSYKKDDVFFIDIKGLSNEKVDSLMKFLGPQAVDTGKWEEFEHSVEIKMSALTPELLKALKQVAKP